jgi:hypothetical protein
MWERYCRGVNAVVYVVDAADHANVDTAKSELHELLNKPTLGGIPLLVLGNKNDLPGAMTVRIGWCITPGAGCQIGYVDHHAGCHQLNVSLTRRPARVVASLSGVCQIDVTGCRQLKRVLTAK